MIYLYVKESTWSNESYSEQGAFVVVHGRGHQTIIGNYHTPVLESEDSDFMLDGGNQYKATINGERPKKKSELYQTSGSKKIFRKMRRYEGGKKAKSVDNYEINMEKNEKH